MHIRKKIWGLACPTSFLVLLARDGNKLKMFMFENYFKNRNKL